MSATPSVTTSNDVILRAGVNCWRIEQASRASYLIDAAQYFACLREVVIRAERSLTIIGWDIDSRTRLVPRSEPVSDGWPTTLLALLNAVLAKRPGLRAYVLGWDFSVMYTFEREMLPEYRFGWDGHDRLTFRLDGTHPVGASHHEKLVVIDDQVAFVGGLDLTIRRWDTKQHLAHDPNRVDPAGAPYHPMHDVQMMVEGPIARALGELARERWRVATGQEIPRYSGHAAPPLWPPDLVPDLSDVPIGIARTLHALDESGVDIREVLELTLESIAAARQWIYIEHQFFTSAAVGSAIEASLAAPFGPEVVMVLPLVESGWLERGTMGVLRARLLQKLRAGDSHGRLRLYCPVVPDLSADGVNIHTKVMTIDDRLARVGSANLSNRSMGLDTECDLAFEDDGSSGIQGGAALLRNRLLAEHLETTPGQVAQRIAEYGSLIGAIESLRGGRRSLEPLPDPGTLEPPGVDLTLLDGAVCDPEKPAPEALIEMAVPSNLRRPLRRSLLRYALISSLGLVLIAVWRLTPLRELLAPDRLAELGRQIRDSPAATFIVFGCYLAGALVLFPITVLLAATALVFGPGKSLAYSLGGALASAALTYSIGRLVDALRPRWLEGRRMQRLRRQLTARGVLAVVVARLLPVGNFTLINVAAGAVPIRFRDFMLGNLLGLLPGVLGLTFFADRLGQAVRSPRAANLALLAILVLAFLGGLAWLRRRVKRATKRRPSSGGSHEIARAER
jgi:phosphatidylserine/phosphatidylglycerophosphate/cardiolipin synthase-like enzyme/uncharacterized membrane protein YdjX (TVP38/TMEM64 family)